MDRYQKIALIIIIGFILIISLIVVQTEEKTRQYNAENILDSNNLPTTQILTNKRVLDQILINVGEIS